MKKFTKLFLSCTAVAALTAAVATSAMAAEKTLTAKYSVAEGASVGTVTITCASEDEAKTLLILKPEADLTNITKDDILQIDQAAEIVTATVPVLDATEADVEANKGTYTVLMGGTSGDIYKGTFKIGGSDVEIGNVNGDEAIDPADAVLVVQHFGGVITLEGDQYIAANANGDEAVDPADAVCIVRRFAGLSDGIGLIEPPAAQ